MQSRIRHCHVHPGVTVRSYRCILSICIANAVAKRSVAILVTMWRSTRHRHSELKLVELFPPSFTGQRGIRLFIHLPIFVQDKQKTKKRKWQRPHLWLSTSRWSLEFILRLRHSSLQNPNDLQWSQDLFRTNNWAEGPGVSSWLRGDQTWNQSAFSTNHVFLKKTMSLPSLPLDVGLIWVDFICYFFFLGMKRNITPKTPTDCSQMKNRDWHLGIWGVGRWWRPSQCAFSIQDSYAGIIYLQPVTDDGLLWLFCPGETTGKLMTDVTLGSLEFTWRVKWWL